MLALQRWSNIETTLGECIVFAGMSGVNILNILNQHYYVHTYRHSNQMQKS